MGGQRSERRPQRQLTAYSHPSLRFHHGWSGIAVSCTFSHLRFECGSPSDDEEETFVGRLHHQSGGSDDGQERRADLLSIPRAETDIDVAAPHERLASGHDQQYQIARAVADHDLDLCSVMINTHSLDFHTQGHALVMFSERGQHCKGAAAMLMARECGVRDACADERALSCPASTLLIVSRTRPRGDASVGLG